MGPSAAFPASSNGSEPIFTPGSTAAPSPAEPAESPPNGASPAPSSRPPECPSPKLRLEIRDLTHPGASLFLQSLNVAEILLPAIYSIHGLLYSSPKKNPVPAPPTRSVTVVLRPMSGVAYTTSTDLDVDHKEIHLSLSYVSNIKPASRVASEITGVLTHELVHCYQYNGKGKCPGGLIEGIADWVRLRCDLAPPHWKRDEKRKARRDKNWDRGYDCTAYFLDYLEERFGKGTVASVNETLRAVEYVEEEFWTELFGATVQELWEDYCAEGEDDDDDDVDSGVVTSPNLPD